MGDKLVAEMAKVNVNQSSVFESDDKPIIALDFGTTFSGIAYCFPSQRDSKVVAIIEWPGEDMSIPRRAFLSSTPPT